MSLCNKKVKLDKKNLIMILFFNLLNKFCYQVKFNSTRDTACDQIGHLSSPVHLNSVNIEISVKHLINHVYHITSLFFSG